VLDSTHGAEALKPPGPAGLHLQKDGVITYGKHTSSAYTHKDPTSRAEPFGNSSLLYLQASSDDDVVLYRLGLHNQIYVSIRFTRKFPLLFFFLYKTCYSNVETF